MEMLLQFVLRIVRVVSDLVTAIRLVNDLRREVASLRSEVSQLTQGLKDLHGEVRQLSQGLKVVRRELAESMEARARFTEEVTLCPTNASEDMVETSADRLKC